MEMAQVPVFCTYLRRTLAECGMKVPAQWISWVMPPALGEDWQSPHIDRDIGNCKVCWEDIEDEADKIRFLRRLTKNIEGSKNAEFVALLKNILKIGAIPLSRKIVAAVPALWSAPFLSEELFAHWCVEEPVMGCDIDDLRDFRCNIVTQTLCWRQLKINNWGAMLMLSAAKNIPLPDILRYIPETTIYMPIIICRELRRPNICDRIVNAAIDSHGAISLKLQSMHIFPRALVEKIIMEFL